MTTIPGITFSSENIVSLLKLWKGSKEMTITWKKNNQQSINQSIFILQNNPSGFSNRRRLDRATDKFVHHSNVTLCSSQYKTDSSIPMGSPFSMSALLRIYSVTAETGERPGGHLAIIQTTQGRTICNSSSSSGSKGGGCAPPGAGEE